MNEIVAVARSWIGTPYRHQGALQFVGCDCLGLVRGIWRQYYGCEPELPGPYGMDWAERSGEERLIEAARRHCGPEIPIPDMQAGDIVIFRWRSGMAAKHAGILSGDAHFIHAYEQVGVIESALVPSWRRRIAAAFRFPEAPLLSSGITSPITPRQSAIRAAGKGGHRPN